ncbi:hypothetical protein Cni_G18810 [Canna indica]|uniref:Cystatin domain-containing protein n=1 Tax=Canna indica TaxID=4628 RepID=A0AAQ3QER0_9LILI|nr:hypothetical protein Cni_G18810 [Canna indica]
MIKDVSDPHVREIAHFPLSEHNDDVKTCLVLIKVVKGETQVAAGTKYRLVLEVMDYNKGKTARYVAAVLEKKWENFLLVSQMLFLVAYYCSVGQVDKEIISTTSVHAVTECLINSQTFCFLIHSQPSRQCRFAESKSNYGWLTSKGRQPKAFYSQLKPFARISLN